MSVEPPDPCDPIQEGISKHDLKDLKVLFQVPTPGSPKKKFTIFSIKIRQDLSESPCTYAKLIVATCFLIWKGTEPDADGETWDTHVLTCPQGPPCKFLLDLVLEWVESAAG